MKTPTCFPIVGIGANVVRAKNVLVSSYNRSGLKESLGYFGQLQRKSPFFGMFAVILF